MNKEDKITAKQVLLKHYDKDNIFQSVERAMEEYADLKAPVQEQSKQEVTDRNLDLEINVLQSTCTELYKLGKECAEHNLEKYLDESLNIMNTAKSVLSLPQEKKDKVTGVGDEPNEVLEDWELLLDAFKNNELGKHHIIAKLSQLLSSKAVEQKPEAGKSEVNAMKKLFRESDNLMEKNGIEKCINILSEIKAVEQKEPDNLVGWHKEEEFRSELKRMLYSDEIANELAPIFTYHCNKSFERGKFSASPPIQEAEHKQGVELEVNINYREFTKTKLDLPTLEFVKFSFDIHSDHSTQCNGYKSLCQMIEETESLPLKEEQKSVTDDKYGYLMKSNDEHFFVMGKNMNHAIEIIEEHTKSGWEFEAHKSIVVLRSLFGEKGKEESK